MKIAYFGLPLGAILLQRHGYELGLVVLSPMSAPGRRRLQRRAGHTNLIDALTLGDPFLDGVVESTLRAAEPDLLLSWFWTRRLPSEWLHCAKLGAYGVHPSLLPRHRGPNPYFAAIDAGDVVTGATLHALEADYDTGAIIETRPLEVGTRNAWQLARAIDRPSLELLLEAAARARDGRLGEGKAQLASLATWAGEPTGEQLRVDWAWSTERVLRRVRALSPVPGLALEIDGIKFFVTEATAVPRPNLPLLPGEAEITPRGLTICTGDAAITVLKAVLSDDVCIDKDDLANLLAERRR